MPRPGSTADRAMTGDDDTTGGYGWFEGVFVPTLLTILGVILFLRTGWVVGNAGLAGGVSVIVLSYAITGATALSIASVATNTTIGSGGAYAIIARSLGIEAGGAIGIPLYLSQTLVIALYLFGFRDGWLRIFPDHSALAVDLVGFAVLVAIALVSAAFSFRIQFVILAAIVVAIVSMAAGAAATGFDVDPTWWGSYPGGPDDPTGTDFWGVFAVFFPATTGIMAGANMSGELADSRRAIPLGTLLAVGVSLLVYLASAVWLASSVSTTGLVTNYTVMIDAAAWGPAVLAGLLGATFSSALASVVGAPRILQALADHDLLPRSGWLATRADDGEPRHALYVTGAIALGAIALRQLNALAPVITLFFLITYGTINLVVVVEQVLDLPSFRPRLRLPTIVPLFGFGGCLFAMFIVNPVFTILGLVIVVAIAVVIARRRVDNPFSDLRGALFRRIERWAGARAKAARASAERSWRPNLLVPTDDVERLGEVLPFLQDVVAPSGSVKVVGYGGIDGDAVGETLERGRQRDLDMSWSVIDVATAEDAVASSVADPTATGSPNIVFVWFPASTADADAAEDLFAAAAEHDLGVLVLSHVHQGRVGGRGIVNLWVRPQPEGADVSDIAHSHLAILLALKLQRNWAGGQLNLLTAIAGDGRRGGGGDADRDDRPSSDAAEAYLHALIGEARLPGPPAVYVFEDTFHDAIGRSPTADANVFAIGPEVDFSELHDLIERADTPCAFVRDGGTESVFV